MTPTYWTIKAPSGFYWTDTMSSCRAEAIRLGVLSIALEWKEMRKLGYRCVRVRIEEVE